MANLYFAFGSNLDRQQMRERCPRSRLIGPALLQQHALAFTGYSPRWGGAVATAVQHRKHTVFGALYELEDDDVERLDRFEGCPKVYERIRKIVVDDRGKRRRAYLYVHTSPNKLGVPSREYLRTIQRGYKSLGLNQKLVRIAWGVS